MAFSVSSNLVMSSIVFQFSGFFGVYSNNLNPASASGFQFASEASHLHDLPNPGDSIQGYFQDESLAFGGKTTPMLNSRTGFILN